MENNYIKITKLVTPAGLNKYYDEIDENSHNYSENELIMHKYDIELCMAVISSLDNEYVFGSIPVYLYPISHKDKYGFEYYDELQAFDYFTRKELFKIRKYNKGIKILNINNKEYKNIKIDLYRINNNLSYYNDNNEKVLELLNN